MEYIIPDNSNKQDFTIVYKGKERSENIESESLCEIKTSKKKLIECLHYFDQKQIELQYVNEIYIHDIFHIDLFQDFINSVTSKHIKISQTNCNELLEISRKYGYDEVLEITQEFILKRPDIKSIIDDFLTNNSNENDHKNDDINYDFIKEEIISKNLDVCLQNDYLKRIPLAILIRILNSPNRVLHNHQLLFQFIIEKMNNNDKKEENLIKILPSCLDYTKMSKEEIKQLINNSNFSNEFRPSNEINMMKSILQQLEEIDQQNSRLDSIVTEIKEKETQNQNFYNEVNKKIDQQSIIIKSQETTIKNLQILIEKLELQIKEIKSDSAMPYSKQIFYQDLSLTEPGILNYLKNQEKSPFDRFFITSQSSNDVYNLLDPSTTDMFGVAFNSNFFIEFTLEKEISITGFIVFSSYKGFPKSFDIEVEGRLIHQITNAKELNGKNYEMKLINKPINGRKIKFIRTGPSWDQGPDFYTIKRFEVLSNDDKFSNGVFSTLVKEYNDSHNCPVFIVATYFDFNRFFNINADSHISTLNSKDSWFQIELTKGFAVLNGIRLKQISHRRIKYFKVMCKTDKDWIILLEINKNNNQKDKDLEIYKFPQASPPTKFVRLVQTGPNSDKSFFLSFIHLDYFGTYI